VAASTILTHQEPATKWPSQTRWHEAPAIVREAYEAMSLKLSLPMTGLNVWMKLSLTQDEGLRQTLERQSALSLPMPPNPYAEVP